MNPDIQNLIADLARRVEALEAKAAQDKEQLIRPDNLGLASIEVLKAALIRAGFTFP